MKAVLLAESKGGSFFGPKITYDRETEFEAVVLDSFSRMFPQHISIIYNGTYEFEGERYRPDLALIAKDFSHWFVIEVELRSHSLFKHVLPQVRSIRYGEAMSDCVDILSRELAIGASSAATLVHKVPRSVVVVADSFELDWQRNLAAVQVQYVSIEEFGSGTNGVARVIEGEMQVVAESLGFGTYSAIDVVVRFPSRLSFSDHSIYVEGDGDLSGVWKVSLTPENTWLIFSGQRPKLKDGCFVQILRTVTGNYLMRE